MSDNKTKELLKQLCQEMAKNPHIMTKDDFVRAAALGVCGNKLNDPLLGAVLGVSIEASRRAGLLARELLQKLPHSQVEVAEQSQQQTEPAQIKPVKCKPK